MFLLSSPVLAADWVIQRSSGKVYLLSPGVEPVAARSGMVLPKGVTLATRSGAKALLVRGRETILVSPNSTVAISRLKSTGETTTLLQRDGQVTVDVQKRARPHFVVETPFLAAVVKGTRFGVQIRKGQAKVEVERGLVQVIDLDTGERSDIGAGQQASTQDGVGLSVTGSGTLPSVESGLAPASSTFTAPLSPAASLATDASPAGSTRSTGTVVNDSSPHDSGPAGNAGGNGNSNAGGNGNGNAGGNGNGNAGGNGNGNAGGNGNGNAGGNGNGNAGGNGNGNAGGDGNGNAGGNGNGNAGGNGNGNAGGNGNGNAGGNGNGNAGGNGNGNAGGNGNGNAGGNGNGNAGGNGNGNAGGNGNGNAGGNGNGRQ
ncbi:FecR family protein [Pannonibacter carbonis]|uniref:FecR family protein n=1 Tax=Pannonibacter carbonis TaxID=2067569 RepID=UPI001AD8FAD8|nr:FecR family protein [Pannonibacter carbonis]